MAVQFLPAPPPVAALAPQADNGKLNQLFAQLLLRGATSDKPIQSHWEGVNKLVQGALAGMAMGREASQNRAAIEGMEALAFPGMSMPKTEQPGLLGGLGEFGKNIGAIFGGSESKPASSTATPSTTTLAKALSGDPMGQPSWRDDAMVKFDNPLAAAVAGQKPVPAPSGSAPSPQTVAPVASPRPPVSLWNGPPGNLPAPSGASPEMFSPDAVKNAPAPAAFGKQSSAPIIDQLKQGIAGIESGGRDNPYAAIGATHPKLGRAIGKYQVMEANIGPWTKEALGRPLTAEEFLANPQAQEAVASHKLSQYVSAYGPEGAARAWFGGPGGIDKPHRTDVHGRINIGEYGKIATRGMDQAPVRVASLDPNAAFDSPGPKMPPAGPQVAQQGPFAFPPATPGRFSGTQPMPPQGGPVPSRGGFNEAEFQRGIRQTPWFREYVAKYGEEPDLNTKDYDYRAAWAAGARPDVRDPGDGLYHWPSQFKGDNHPNRYVNGVDTKTGRPAPQQFAQAPQNAPQAQQPAIMRQYQQQLDQIGAAYWQERAKGRGANTKLLTKLQEMAFAVRAQMMKAESFEPVRDQAGNIIGQRSRLTGEVKSYPQGPERYETVTGPDGQPIAQRATRSGKVEAYPQGPKLELKEVNGRLFKFDPSKGTAEDITPPGMPSGMFTGKSVDAQALNHLIQTGKLTPEQAAQFAAGKTVTGPNGEQLFLTPEGVFSREPAATPTPGTLGAQPSSGEQRSGVIPLTSGKDKNLTEAQSKDAVFVTRAAGAVGKLEKVSGALTSLSQSVGGSLPLVGNYLKSPEYQKAEQAGKEFVQAILRKDTGAAITKEETEEYGSVYLPRPGDSTQVLQQKAASRQRALHALRMGLPPQAILVLERGGVDLTPQQSAPANAPQPIDSKDQYDNLPSGATFTAPDGTVRRKP